MTFGRYAARFAPIPHATKVKGWRDRVMSAEDAAALIQNGMTVGMSGFTRAGEAKDVALARRAVEIIENCADPYYRPALRAYFREACRRGGQTPHCLEKALSWHQAALEHGSMHSVV
ncbi:hypothetical protein BIS06_14880 [Halomonas sp. BBD48]|nr:hypothetical protein [Halomonas sp. BBD48]